MSVQFGGGGWPRDFKEWMFLGTAAVYANRAFHGFDAHDEDTRVPDSFVDRPSRFDPSRPETFDEQREAFRRGEGARTHLHALLRSGALDACWRGPDGVYRPITPSFWHEELRNDDGSSRDSVMRTALTWFGVPDGYFAPDQVPTGERFIYVSRSQFLDVIDGMPRPVPIEGLPALTLPTHANGRSEDETFWSLAAAVVWIASRDGAATAGALGYPAALNPEIRRNLAALSLVSFARPQIAAHYCRCTTAVCSCWDRAVDELTRAALRGDLDAEGLRNDQGDPAAIPRSAWLSPIEFHYGADLAPEREGHTRWTNIRVIAADVIRVWPAASTNPDQGSSLKPNAPPEVDLPLRRRRGRRVIYDWTGMLAELTRIADEDGLDEVFDNQAAAEEWASGWLEEKHGAAPAVSSVREKVSPVYQARADYNAAKAAARKAATY